MYTRGGIFIRSPFLRFFTDDGTAGGAGGEENQNQEPMFPANTPVKDMTPEQQAAYWQDKSRKHENRAKALGDWTPEKIKALQDERDALRTQGQTDTEKELEKAREEGRTEVRSVLNRERATSALEKALQGRAPDAGALLSLDVNTFIVDGKVDDAAVKAWVDDHSEEVPKGNQQQRRNPDNGQGNRGNAGGSGKSVAAGRDLFAERHKKKNTTTTS